MPSVTAHEIFCYYPPLYMQVASFAWLNKKIEKITTEDEFENYRFFAQNYRTNYYLADETRKYHI